MAYRFAVEREDYSDYASGRVFYNLPGHTAFPVRLASEVFQRCMQIRQAHGLAGPVGVYDPCCGGAYHLAVLGCLHREQIREISASDIDEQALGIARRNLALLTSQGLERRIAEIEGMRHSYHKASHDEALASAERLRDRRRGPDIALELFQANALSGRALREHLSGRRVDVVFSDIPYGIRSAWQLAESTGGAAPGWLLLENLRELLAAGAVVAIASAKQEKIGHDGYKQVGRMKVGTRGVVFLLAC